MVARFTIVYHRVERVNHKVKEAVSLNEIDVNVVNVKLPGQWALFVRGLNKMNVN